MSVPSFSVLDAGTSHTCGIGPQSVAYCWGQNVYGQLGDGTVSSPKGSPTRLATSLSFLAIAAGGFHSCAIAASGATYCWGEGLGGQLGDDTGTSHPSPTLVANP